MNEKLTLEEKAALLQGWTTWTTRQVQHAGIPVPTACASRRKRATIWAWGPP